MRDRFGMDFKIIDAEFMKTLRRTKGVHANPWQSFPRLITSIDYLKRDRPLRLFKECLPSDNESPYPRRFDLLVLDEAHNVAPSGTGNYALDSQRTNVIRQLAPHFEHKLFLSATPHNGYTESFTALLELLDPQRFARGVQPDKKQLASVMVRRLKKDVKNWDGSPKFPDRVLDYFRVNYGSEEREAHNKLREYTELRLRKSVNETNRYATEFVLKLLKKRLFSSPAAFDVTLEKHIHTVTTKRAEIAETAKLEFLKKQFDDRLAEEFGDDELLSETTNEVVGNASQYFTQLKAEERELLEWLRNWSIQASSYADAKAQELIEWLKANIKPNGEWKDERVVIFTEYRETQKWLLNLLSREGLFEDERLLILYGGVPLDEREKIKAAFQADAESSKARILLATDAASEGINLQNHCHQIIHYEIPWNPNRLEQRNGRVDRYGQKSPIVRVYHFVGGSFDEKKEFFGLQAKDLDDDLEFLMRAAQKVNTIREDLGKVGPVIASQVEEAMLGKISRLDTTAAEEKTRETAQLLRFETDIVKEIRALRETLNETKRRLRLSPETVESVVKLGLRLAGQPSLIPVEENPKLFHVPALSHSWSACTEGLSHPHTGVIRPITFDSNLSSGRDDVVLAHLNHRLVQMCLRLLRAEIWASTDTKKLNRVTTRVVPDDFLATPAIICFGRIVVVGDNKNRLHEEIISSGIKVLDGRIERMNVGDVQATINAMTSEAVPERRHSEILRVWERNKKAVLTSLQNRARERTKGLEKNLQERADEEVSKMTAVLTELQKNIRNVLLVKDVPLQLNLFEEEQYKQDYDNLRLRLEQIPGEMERETREIRKRFENPTPLLFPLAVMFLIPRSIALRN
jgi:SNF2 family DNA or RNA helicase